MKKIILILMLFSLSAIAEEVKPDQSEKITTMAELKPGDELLVTNDHETFASASFRELCYVLTPDGFESFALLDNVNSEEANFIHTLMPDKTPVESVKMVTGVSCKPDGDRFYLVPKSQLIGLLTRSDNIMKAEHDTGKALRAMAELFDEADTVREEIAEIRRIVVD